MNNTTKILVSTVIAAALLTGCGNSTSSKVDPTPKPTPTIIPVPTPVPTPPAPTPTPTPEYAKPAPVNTVSVTKLIQNNQIMQTRNINLAVQESVTSLFAAAVTEAAAINIINNFAGDVDCSAISGGQGSGTIHAEASSLGVNLGNSYTIDFNDCKFDTGMTLSTLNGKYQSIPREMSTCMEETGQGFYEEIKTGSFKDLKIVGKNCTKPEIKYDADDIQRIIGDLAYVTGITTAFQGRHISTNSVSALSLNDIVSINGTLVSTVNFNNVNGNVWDTTFGATGFSSVVRDNAEAFEKFRFDLEGNLEGSLNVVVITAPDFKGTAAIAGGNDLSSNTKIDSTNNAVFIGFGIIGEKSAHQATRDLTLDMTQPNTWRRRAEANFNDAGNGYTRSYFDDNAAAYHGELSTYNENFIQTRNVVTDPSSVPTGVARRSSWTQDGKFGFNSINLPIVWNTQGAFDATTVDTAVMKKLQVNDYMISSGYVTLLGDKAINFKYLPDAAPVAPNDGNIDGDIILDVDGDVLALPSNFTNFLQIFPQP